MTYIFEEPDHLRTQGKSLEAAEAYQEVAQTSDDQSIVAAAWHMSAVCLNQAGQHQESQPLFDRASEIYHSLGDDINLARVTRDQGTCLLNQKDYQGAKVLLQKSVTSLEDTNKFGELSMSQAKLAVVLARLEEVGNSETLIIQAIENVKKSDNSFYVATAYGEAGRVYFLNGKPRDMIDCLNGALGALDLEDEPHAKRRAELFQGLSYAYDKTGNQALSKRAGELAEKYLAELDDETATRIRNYLK